MATVTESSLLTRRSLLSRLRDLDDAESWRVFFDTYWQLLYNVARKSGLPEAEAQDVVQETVIGVARQMPAFHYDPAKGTFKQWLLRITRRRIVDQWRRAYRQPPQVDLATAALEEDESEALIDPEAGRIAEAWEEEWEHYVLAQAIDQVKHEVNPKHFQIFECLVLKEWPVARVTETLGTNAALAYLARHRVSRAVKSRARALREELQHGAPRRPG